MARKTNIFLAIGLVLITVIVGCTNEVITPDVPTDIAITQTTDFLEGQTFNSSNFSVKVKYLYDDEYKDVPASILVFNDADKNGVVSYGDTVTASVGTDPYENPVVKTSTINVYAIQYITAEATKESYAYVDDFKPVPTDLEVTAHYSDGKTLVLGPDDYSVTVTPDVAPADEETFDGTFTVTVANKLMGDWTQSSIPAGAQYTVDVTFTQTLVPESFTITEVLGIVNYSGVFDSESFAATTFKLPKLDYETSYDLPIDYSKVSIAVKGVNEKGTTETRAFAADSEVFGDNLVLSYVNADTGEQLFDGYDKYAYATASGSPLSIVATYNDEPVAGGLGIELAETSLKVQYAGDGIVIGTKNSDINIDDFRVYLIVDKESENITENLEAADFYFTGSKNSAHESEMVDQNHCYVGVSYNGLSTDVNGIVKVEALSQYVDYKLSTPVIKFKESFALDQLYYPEGKVMELVTGAIESITSTRTNADETTADVTIDVDDPNLKIRIMGSDNYDFNDENVVPAVLYVEAIYDYGAEATVSSGAIRVPVNATTDMEITSVEFDPMYDDNPAVGDSITWHLTVNGNGGVIFESEAFSPVSSATGTTTASGMSLTFRYFIGGVEIKTAASTFIPTTIGEEAVNDIIIKVNGVNSKAVSLEAGRWYVAPDCSDLVATATEEYLAKAYIGDEISTNKGDYTLTEESIEAAFGVTDIAEIPEEYIPEIVEIIPEVPGAKIVDGENANAVTVVVSYVDKNGEAKEAELTTTEFTGASWYKTPADGVSIRIKNEDSTEYLIGSGTTASSPFDVANYKVINDFETILDKVGTGIVNELVSYKAEVASGNATINTAADGAVTSIRLGEGGVVKITVTYPTNPNKDAGTATFYIG